jgi:hypothetical protein
LYWTFTSSSKRLLDPEKDDMKWSDVVWCGDNTDEVDDGRLQEPQYYSYTDPNMGESSPTFDAHTPLPDMNSQGLMCTVSIFFCVSFELAFVLQSHPLIICWVWEVIKPSKL